MPTWRRFARFCIAAKPAVAFVALLCLLDAALNIRYPAGEAKFWYLLPSVDAICLLAVYVLLGLRAKRMPAVAHGVLVALFVFVRLLRLADGIEYSNFLRTFNLYIDLPLLPELVRFLYATQSHIAFTFIVLGVAVGLVAFAWVAHRVLSLIERLSALPVNRRVFAGVTAAFLLASLLRFDRTYPERYTGAFAASVLRRLADEAAFFVSIYGHKTERRARIESVERDLARTPSNLAKLGKRNVLLFLVESYGRVVFDRPTLAEHMLPLYAKLESDLGASGYAIASRFLASSTYGGGSWLAHATIATGIRIDDQWQYELARATQPRTLESFLHAAGHDTVLVQPGTTREASGPDIHQFDRSFFGWSMGYKGPSFGWAPMPDQYVLEFVGRRVVAPAAGLDATTQATAGPRPLFVECVLVSSHAPWAEQPPLVDEGLDLGDGALFARLPAVHYDIDVAALSQGVDGYLRSLEYDFTVLERFLLSVVHDDGLVIVVGDHQPSPAITQNSPSWDVPIHVISRSGDLVEPFRSRGYVPGMRPDATAPPLGLETLLGALLRDFSDP